VNKKELIRQSAIKIIADEGYYNTTIKMIADEAGIAVGTIYNYFNNKQDILNHIFAVELDKRIKILTRVKEDESSLKEKLNTFLDLHFNKLEANPDVATVLVQEMSQPRKYGLEAIDNFMNELPELLGEIIEVAVEVGEIREVNSELIANAIFHTIRGMVTKTKTSELDYNLKDVKEEIINFIWLGLNLK